MTLVMTRSFAMMICVSLAALSVGCGDDDAETPPATETPSEADTTETPETPAAQVDPTALPDSLPNGLLLSYAQFVVEDGTVNMRKPGPARVEILYRRDGEWKVDAFEDGDSNVFHKAMVYTPKEGAPAILTVGGMGAFAKLWRRNDAGKMTSSTLWTESFGGTFDRMRDVEIGDLFGDGNPDLAIATHDQGVVAVLRPKDATGNVMDVVKVDERANTFVHEIELGDIDGNGTLEVYATPSEPNRLGADAQHGEVVRYVPKTGEGRTIVADLGNRHAKEILVDDVDGDGRDELYVAVEALTRGDEGALEIVEPVEIRRYDADTPKDAKVIIATIPDRFTRFLTAGDVDGDGKKEMVAAAFSSGLWLLRPGRDPKGEWAVESIDRDSGGFEHATVLADLDGNGTDELYVAADNQNEIRRYVWVNGRARRETLLTHEIPKQRLTWNLMPVPEALLPH